VFYLFWVGERESPDVGLVVVFHAHPPSGHVARGSALHVGQRHRGQPAEALDKEEDGVGQLDLSLVQHVRHVVDLDHGGLGLVAVGKHVLHGLDARALGSGHQEGVAAHLVGQGVGDVVAVLERVHVLGHVLDVDVAPVAAVEVDAQPDAVLALRYLFLESFHHGCVSGCGVYADDAHAPGDVHHGEPHHDVGASPVAKPDDALDAQGVEDVDQVLTDLLDGGPGDVGGQGVGIGLLTQQVDVDEDGVVLDGGHGRVVGEPQPLVVVGPGVVDGHEDADRVLVILAMGQLQVTLDVDVESSATLGGDAMVAQPLGPSQLGGGHLLLVLVSHDAPTASQFTNETLSNDDVSKRSLWQ